MPDLNPHGFEARGDGDPYCVRCGLPLSNRVHSAGMRRTRAVLVLDVPADMSDDQVAQRLAVALNVEPRIVVADLQVIL
jgi:hypothetical protein